MRNVSTAFKQLLAKDKRKYNITLEITLTDNTVLTVINENIMDGGIDIDDAVSQDSKFTALGSTVIGSCTVVLYDITEKYSDYDFSNAKVIVKANLDGAIASDEITFGEYTVDDPTYNESSVTLSLLDNMCQFDREYDSYNIYNEATTIQDVVFDACTKCGVLYDSSMSTFPNYNFVVPNAPKDDCTYREVIGWCATIAGCFARITSDGKLKFSWFNTSAFNTDDATNVDGGTFDSATPYATGDSLNGGTFNPWSDPSTKDGGSFTDRSGIHHITTLRTQNLGVDDVVITGIQVSYDVESENSTEQETATVGTDDYTISIENNPFITKNNYSAVLNFLQPIIIGLRFRPCNITHPNDPTIEAGDVGYVWDTKGVQHRILITRVTFNPSSLQSVICGAESPGKNSSSRLTEVTKAIVKSQRLLNEEKTIRQQLEEDFQEKIANSRGLYWTKIEDIDGSVTVYAHDKTDLAESSTVLKINSGAIATTGNYTSDDTTTQWYGFEFDGVWLANIISTIGLDFDWGVGGKLTITDNQGNETFFADADTGVVRIKANSFSLTDGSTLSSIKTEAINSAVSSSNGYTDTKIADYQGTVNAVVQNLQSQIDGQIMSWYYDHEPTMQNEPASNWTTTALRQQHEGDIFYWKTTGYAYRFMQSNSTWGWTLIQDTDITTAIAKAEDAQETADHKRRVFVTQPYPPYDIGDLWTEGNNGDLYRCETARSAGSFTASDWSLATKYTDDSALNTFLTGTYASTIQSIQSQIDGKIETFYQSSDPSSSWTTTALQTEHRGDIWYCTNTTGTYAQKTWQWSGTAWQEMKTTPPASIMDSIDGKAQIFISRPTPPYHTGDLWFNSTTSDIMTCITTRTSGSYSANDWQKRNKYTDDSAVTTLNTSLTQQEIFNRLTNNGQAQGIYLQNGKLYLNFAYAVGQLLKLGGANNSNGTLEVYNSSNVRIGKWDKDGAEITGVLKMISSNTYATVGSSLVYNVETVSGFKSRTLENFQYVIPYGSNGNIKALKTFVKANNGELQEIFAAAGNTAKRVVVLTTGSYLPEISTSSDLDNVGGFIEEVSYSDSTGLQYRLYDGAGWRINDGTTFKINNTDILITTGGKSITPSKLNDATHNLSWNNEWYSSTHFTYGILHFDGNKIAFDSSSSRRYKHNINYNLTEDRIPNNLLRLPVAEFIFNDNHPLQYSDMQGKTIPGIIAEDVAKIYPSATIYDSEGNVESWDERRIIPGMLALIQEQDRKIKSQEAEIEDLKSRLEKLERAIMNM